VSRWTPCKRAQFIRRLRTLGFDGPFSGGQHAFMIHGNRRLAIPSNSEYPVPQLKQMLKEVEVILARPITLNDWSSL
jgi:predicted RNA binding protein YcfA (HicA-like mRNA interferase family)